MAMQENMVEEKGENKKDKFTRVYPRLKLFPHYWSMLSAENVSVPGVKIIVNESGTEYQFISFRDSAEKT